MQPRRRQVPAGFPRIFPLPRRPASGQRPARQQAGLGQRRPVPVPFTATQRAQQRRPALPARNTRGFFQPRIFHGQRRTSDIPFGALRNSVKKAISTAVNRVAGRSKKTGRREGTEITPEIAETIQKFRESQHVFERSPNEFGIAGKSSPDKEYLKRFAKEHELLTRDRQVKNPRDKRNLVIRDEILRAVASGQIRSKEMLYEAIGEIAAELGIQLPQKNFKARLKEIEKIRENLFSEKEAKLIDSLFKELVEIDTRTKEGKNRGVESQYARRLSRRAA